MKKKGFYKGRPTLYTEEAVDPQKRMAYQRVVEMLESGAPKIKMAKETGVSRSTIYKIEKSIKNKK